MPLERHPLRRPRSAYMTRPSCTRFAHMDVPAHDRAASHRRRSPQSTLLLSGFACERTWLLRHLELLRDEGIDRKQPCTKDEDHQRGEQECIRVGNIELAGVRKDRCERFAVCCPV